MRVNPIEKKTSIWPGRVWLCNGSVFVYGVGDRLLPRSRELLTSMIVSDNPIEI